MLPVVYVCKHVHVMLLGIRTVRTYACVNAYVHSRHFGTRHIPPNGSLEQAPSTNVQSALQHASMGFYSRRRARMCRARCNMQVCNSSEVGAHILLRGGCRTSAAKSRALRKLTCVHTYTYVWTVWMYVSIYIRCRTIRTYKLLPDTYVHKSSTDLSC